MSRTDIAGAFADGTTEGGVLGPAFAHASGANEGGEGAIRDPRPNSYAGLYARQLVVQAPL